MNYETLGKGIAYLGAGMLLLFVLAAFVLLLTLVARYITINGIKWSTARQLRRAARIAVTGFLTELDLNSVTQALWLNRPLDGYWHEDNCIRIFPSYVVVQGVEKYLVVIEDGKGVLAPEIRSLTKQEIFETFGPKLFDKSMKDFDTSLIRVVDEED